MFVSHQSFFLLFKEEVWHWDCTRRGSVTQTVYARVCVPRDPAAGSSERQVFTAGRGFGNPAHPPAHPGHSGHGRPRSPQRPGAGPAPAASPSPGPSPSGPAGGSAGRGRTPLCLRRGGDAHPGPASRPALFRTHPRTARADTRTRPVRTCTRADAVCAGVRTRA